MRKGGTALVFGGVQVLYYTKTTKGGYAMDALTILAERFGRDSLLALATTDGHTPSVRTVNAYYEDGAFYVITWALSHKMMEIASNPTVALCGEWFSGHGTAENCGHVLKAENLPMLAKLRQVFAAWYGNGHVNEQDEDTVLLRIRLTDGVVFSQGNRYEFTDA